MNTGAPETGPLSGLRIVELSSFVATPLCGLTLAQLGADVIRVEPLGGGPDRGRWPQAQDGTSLYWTGLNRGKSAIEVDLKSDEGQDLVADLVRSGGERGGILISNTDRYSRLSDEAIRARRDDLIHVNLSGKNDGGTAVDYTVQAATGFPLITGAPGTSLPVNSTVPAWDLAAGLYLATGLLAAVHQRHRTGEGSYVKVSLEDVAMATAGQLGFLADAQLNPTGAREPDGNYVYGSFGRDFGTRDGRRFMIVSLTPRQWTDLVRLTGIESALHALEPTLGADFGTEDDRYLHRDILASLVAGWFGRHDADEVRSRLAETRILWSEYRSFTQMAADEARILREHPIFHEVDHGSAGRYLAPSSPLCVNGRSGLPEQAPEIGADTDTVLREELRLDDDTIDRLVGAGVVRAQGTLELTAQSTPA
jgi:2-methylfumaryl-CoA isomerase